MKDPLQIDQLVARPAEVVHHFLRPPLHQGLADPARDVIERLVPRDALPLPAGALALAPDGVADAFGVLDLVQRGGALGAVAATTAGMNGIALELLDAARRLVDVGEQPARGFAVEADGRDQAVAALDLPRPGDGVVLFPILPALRRWIAGQAVGGGQLARRGMQGLGDRSLHRLLDAVLSARLRHEPHEARGRSRPQRTWGGREDRRRPRTTGDVYRPRISSEVWTGRL